MAGFEADGIDDELLLDVGLGVVEETGLGPVVGECGGALAVQMTGDCASGSSEEPAAGVLVCLLGESFVE